MNRSPQGRSPVVPAVAALAVLLVACQAGGAGSPSVAPAAGAAALVTVAESGQVGAHLVDAEGRSLYVFLEDSPGTSACEGPCLDAWPPATVEAGVSLVAGDGVTAELGTLERDDGSLQLTLDGMPLYRYAADAGPGQVTGEGVGGVWFVARPDGSAPPPSASAQASAEPSDGPTYDPYDY
jgi:predicted lipoprotein with Yx(FWY)xxD motif